MVTCIFIFQELSRTRNDHRHADMKYLRHCVFIVVGLAVSNICFSVIISQVFVLKKNRNVYGLFHVPTLEYQQMRNDPATLRKSANYSYINPFEYLHSYSQHSEESSDVLFYFCRYKLNEEKVQIMTEETIIYPQFNMTEPNFITQHARGLFFKDNSSIKMMGVHSTEKLTGKIYEVRNGTFQLPYDCGYRSNVSFVLKNRDVQRQNWYHTLVPLIVSDGWAFQHFLDGTLPKIVQALKYIRQPQVKVLLQPPRDKIILEFLEKLNISGDKIVMYNNKAVGADNLLFTCNTPPLHPRLWQRARVLLGAPDSLHLPKDKANIVIITRAGCFNCGRRLLNLDALELALKDKFKTNKVLVFKGPYNLTDTIELFGKTSVVIGVHGGGMYNVNFCPRGTTVIEIMPTYPDGKIIRVSDKIIWMQSVILGHEYWRLPEVQNNSRADVKVDITLVEKIISRSLAAANSVKLH